MDKLLNILLQRNDSAIEWGFGLALDYDNQMVIDSVKCGTISSHYMDPGDAVLQIAGRSTKAMTVEKACHLVVQSGNAVEVIIKKRPQGTTWTSITPSTPTFSPTKFTPSTQQATWKPSFQAPNDSQETNVIVGSVKQDPSGGFVHTFGSSKKPSTPQTASSNSSGNPPWQNFNNSAPSRQESVNSSPSPRYVQEIVVPTAQVNYQSRSPKRQTSFQSNPSQFSPVQQSPQRSGQGTPVYFQPQNNGFDNRANGGVYQTTRQTPSPYQVSRQDSVPYQTVRQGSSPYQTQRQDSTTYPSSWSSPNNSSTHQPSRQDSWNQSSQQMSPRQDSWNQSPQQMSPRQDSWSNQPTQQNIYQPVRQDSSSNSVTQIAPSYPTSRQDSWSSTPSRPDTFPYQPPSPHAAPGLFSKQNSASPSSPVRYDPVTHNSTPGLQRQSSVQYQPSPKPFSPSYSPSEARSPMGYSVPQSANSPNTYGAPGPFARQQSSSGSQPWSPGPVETFPTPPPFSPTRESAPWPQSSDLPSPPPPPPASHFANDNAALPSPAAAPPPPPPPPPVAAPPPPPPPPPPPMPSSSGMKEDIPAWKKQIMATKEAKAAAGPANTVQTPGTPGQELPAALANSMKKDKKPFTYLPGGLDLSEIRSPKMQRRIMANQQYAPPPPSTMGQQVLLQPRTNDAAPQQQQQVQNQMERLNLNEGPQSDRMAAVDAQRRSSTDGGPGYPGQSRSFRILQMMTGGNDATDSAEPQQVASTPKREEDEMRFTGLRRPDNPIPSRAFQTLQKMTQGGEETPSQPVDQRFADENPDEVRQEDGPVDIRYKGGYIPGRSFKMLQEMTGMSEDGVPSGTVVPSVLQEKRQQRKPNLHLNLNQQQPQQKQFPQPSVPASQQTAEEAPKMYRGGRIPSQSFRMLQAMTGESQDSQGEDGTDM